MTSTMSEPTSLRTEHLLVAVVDALAAEVPVELDGAVSLERTRVLLAQAERIKALALQGLSGSSLDRVGGVVDLQPFCG